MPYIKRSNTVRHGTKPPTKSPRPKPPPTTDKVKPKETSSDCNHLYKVLNSNTERTYADGEPYVTDVDAVFYCEKCLDIRQVNKVIDNNASKYTTL